MVSFPSTFTHLQTALEPGNESSAPARIVSIYVGYGDSHTPFSVSIRGPSEVVTAATPSPFTSRTFFFEAKPCPSRHRGVFPELLCTVLNRVGGQRRIRQDSPRSTLLEHKDLFSQTTGTLCVLYTTPSRLVQNVCGSKIETTFQRRRESSKTRRLFDPQHRRAWLKARRSMSESTLWDR